MLRRIVVLKRQIDLTPHLKAAFTARSFGAAGAAIDEHVSVSGAHFESSGFPIPLFRAAAAGSPFAAAMT